MRKSLFALIFVCLITYTFACYANELTPYQLGRRIHYSRNKCFIVQDDGTVFMNRAAKEAFPEVEEWNEIKEISVDAGIVIGLKNDGTVIITRNDDEFDVSNWQDVVEIEADLWCVYALNKNGELLHAEGMFCDDKGTFDKPEWKNLKHIVAENGYLFAVTNDGHVISTYDDDFSELEDVCCMYAEYMTVYFIHDDGSYSCYSIYGRGFLRINEDKYPVAHVTIFRQHDVLLDIYEKIHTDEFSPYYQLDADNIIAVCGGIYVDKDGILYSIEDIDADEPLPTFDLSRYQ